MNALIPIIIVAIVLCVVVAIFLTNSSKKGKGGKSVSKSKSRQAIIREAEKKLKQDTRDPRGLIPLAEIRYNDQDWEKAKELYSVVIEVAPLHQNLNLGDIYFKAGACALQTNDLENAFKNLSFALKENPENFDTLFYLGQTYYKSKQYDKAIPFLNKAMAINRENMKIHEFLGLSYYEKQDYRKAFPHLKATFDSNPENKTVLFAMAESLYHCGKMEKAQPVFLHLRADPEFGAKSCLYSGMYNTTKKQTEKAMKDYQIGLKHTSAPTDILNNIRYNLAQTYISVNNITEAITLLKEIQAITPGYKDVPVLISRYQEMSKNSSLQTYLVAGSSDFLALCRKIVNSYYAKAHVKIIALEAKPDVVEIKTEIETAKWEDDVVFRFYRNTGATGEFVVRDFHGRIRDLKAGRGICFTAGTYTSETKKFVEGRPIDLIDKEGLLKVFDKISHSKPIMNA